MPREEGGQTPALALTAYARTEDPRSATRETAFRVLQCEQRNAEAVKTPGGRLPHAVVEHQPPTRRFDQRRGEPDLVRVPPTALARLKQQLVPSPIAEVGRERNPDMRARVGHRAVKERETPVDPARKQRSVLVVRLHDQSIPLEATEVLGERERHTRPSSAESGVRDHELAELLDEGDPRILDPPELLRIVFRVSAESRRRVDYQS